MNINRKDAAAAASFFDKSNLNGFIFETNKLLHINRMCANIKKRTKLERHPLSFYKEVATSDKSGPS